jgi:iron complex transport system ATP-binding protein
MLLDEPTSYLDIDNQITVHGILDSLRERGKTLVVVMHDLNAIEAVCDDVIMLRNGEVVASGPVVEVLNESNLSRTFDVPFSEVSVDSDRMFVYRKNLKH